MGERPRAADADRRAPLEPRGNQRAVIESDAARVSVDAGAGTGKTTTMLARIEHAICEGGVDPDDVLVLTFANEAAASIREAVAERLDPAAAAAIDVYTYHSFCYRLVREYAYFLGRSPEFEVLTEGGRRRRCRRLLAENDYGFADATREGGSPDDLAASVERFVGHVSREDVDPETLAAALPDVRTLELLGEFVLWLEDAADELTFDNEALRYFNREEHLEAADEALVGYGTLLTYCREKVAEAPAAFREDAVVRDVDRYLRVLQTCVTETREALSLDDPETKHMPRALFANEIRGQSTDRIEQTPFGRLRRYVEFLRLARHYADVYADYRRHLAAENAVDFDELVRLATSLLEEAGPSGESVAAEITGRWEAVYCDEFQDTDEPQFDLITRLTAGPDRPSLLAIGDKDQAIYGWRGTDREGLDRLAETAEEHERIALEVNFRSRQEILDVTNHCAYGPQSSKTLREVDRTPGEYDEPEPPLRVGVVESDELEATTAEQVATTVSRLVNGEFEGVSARTLADVAVIVRTNRQARAVADELAAVSLPHEVSGSARGGISPGVRTVLSYLRALVDPDADAHLRRVLTYRYRVSEPDLERLHAIDGPLSAALSRADPDDLAEPERVERARADFERLSAWRSTYPLSGFFRRFRERTRLEWFLTSEERTQLERLDRALASYDANEVLATLTPRVVDGLERAVRSGERSHGRGSRSEDRVDVMTVHQAKGLQFDTVLVPFLTDEEWCVEGDYAHRARYRLLAATLDDDVDSPLLADLASETVAEEWRVLHVALTRAENHLFCFGSSYDYEGEEGSLGISTADACLPPAIGWSTAGERMDLWETLTAAVERVAETYPETVADCTDELAGGGRTPGTITYYAGGERPFEPLETREAIETVHRLGRLLRNGTLTAAGDAASVAGGDAEIEVPTGRAASALAPETTRFPVAALSTDADLPLAMAHSYTAVRTHEECPRKHYLDHVVNAPSDPPAPVGVIGDGDDDRDESAASGARVVGSVFHDVAEEAFHRNYDDPEEWRVAARRQLTARGLLAYEDRVLACIDRFFDARAPGIEEPLAVWDALAAEAPFTLADIPGVTGDVVGYVDSLRRTPGGALVVVDYKATAHRIPPAEATQLRLYVRACEAMFEEPVARAGYVYVGPAVGQPRVDLFTVDELPAWASVRDALEAVDDPTFAAVTPGSHCERCPHASLGCAPEGVAASVDFARRSDSPGVSPTDDE